MSGFFIAISDSVASASGEKTTFPIPTKHNLLGVFRRGAWRPEQFLSISEFVRGGAADAGVLELDRFLVPSTPGECFVLSDRMNLFTAVCDNLSHMNYQEDGGSEYAYFARGFIDSIQNARKEGNEDTAILVCLI